MSPAAGVPGDPLETFTAAQKLRLSAEIVWLYVRVSLWMRREHNVERIAAALRRGVRESPELTREEIYFGRRLGQIVERVVRPLPGDTRCLARSLVLLSLLANRGLGCTLVIGVRSAPVFGAHAWIERASNPLLEPIEPGGERLTEI